MIIKNIKIQNYRQIEDRTYNFKEGINVIDGDNESGKTTLFNAIISAIFDNPHKMSEKAISDIKRWGHKDAPYIEINIDHEGTSYHIIKDYTKKETIINGKVVSNLDDIINIITARTIMDIS
jgi:exonuclease SbcC